MFKTRPLLLSGIAMALVLGSVQKGETASPRIRRETQAEVQADWPVIGRDTDESRFSRLGSINVRNVSRLGLDWSLDLPGEVSLEATPLAIGGVLYFTGSQATVYAVDGSSGKVLWKFDPGSWKHAPERMGFLGVNRGVAYSDGRIFVGALDGRLIALDARTGTLLWATPTLAPGTTNSVTGAPRVFNGKVIIGSNGADYGFRGYVSAYDAVTGKLAWRFYVTPGTPAQNSGDPVMERAAATWEGEYWKTGTGGAVWDSITFDRELNRIYIGTANAGPYDPDTGSDGTGDKLYTASIVALDADSGKYLWHYQVNPRDAWDYDATQQMTLADLTIRGVRRKVLMQAPKNGFFYVIDRETGKVLSAEKFAKATWADSIDLATGRPVEAKNIRYETGETLVWPYAQGAHNWQSMAFSPLTGLVYIPTSQLATRFIAGKPGSGKPPFAIEDIKADSNDGKGGLLAWDPVQQRARWNVPLDTMWNGGTLATAGNLVFQGDGAGFFSAYDAATGARLWRFNAGLGIIAAPMTYAIGDRQYVSILVGYGGSIAAFSDATSVGWKYGLQKRRLLTFSLDGRKVLPPSPPRDMVIHAVDDPSVMIAPEDAAAGRNLYLRHCMICHGLDLQSPGGTGPDLRESAVALREDSFAAVVHEGALQPRGMPRFDRLDGRELHQIYSYIRAGAREVPSREKTGGTSN